MSTSKDRTARKNRQLRIFLLSLVVVVVAAIAGVFLYQTYVAPYQKVVIKVDDTSVRMGYFLKRLSSSSVDTSSMLQQLTFEQIVKIEASKLGVKITDAELDDAIRTAAAQGSANATDNTTAPPLSESAFQDWYRKTLKETGFSSAEYRDWVRANMLANRLHYALAQMVPISAPQVHLHVIVVDTLARANAAKARLDSGESFASVAAAVSVDSSKENGGDVGWVPYGTSDYDDIIFALSIGQITSPIPTDPSYPSAGQYIFMVSEKTDDREIDPVVRATLQSRALSIWLQQQLTQHDIKIGSKNLAEVGFSLDDQTQAWVEWQRAK